MSLQINTSKVDAVVAQNIVSLCPFHAISYENDALSISAACKMCRICVKKSEGVITEVQEERAQIDKSKWVGITVFADFTNGRLHPITMELLGKAKELAGVTGHPVFCLLIGHHTEKACETLLSYGADRVFVYDAPVFENFRADMYANAFEDFIKNVKPSSILVGATDLGRSLAPRVAARFKTGLTADCTVLEMETNTDLVQIRPAFGGNIMARIITPYTRPQFCTVRYKVFSKPEKVQKIIGSRIAMQLPPERAISGMTIDAITEKKAEQDLCDAQVIVAIGRGVKSAADRALAKELASILQAQLACTRPLVENGWFDAKHQIGLSGRTVKPKLILTLGISGAVQFAAGMRGSDCIIAVNSDPQAPIFDVAHYCLIGDLTEVLTSLIDRIKEAKTNAAVL
ncbi:MAG: electron transfer flavoprotein subunit alpha/FixB family protein [Ruthenibacterium sp.]